MYMYFDSFFYSANCETKLMNNLPCNLNIVLFDFEPFSMSILFHIIIEIYFLNILCASLKKEINDIIIARSYKMKR